MEKKKRKTYDGPKNNKARTKARLLAATPMALEEYGYAGLNINKIAVKAQCDRKLIGLYFGGLDEILEEYLDQKMSLMEKTYEQLYASYAGSLPSPLDVLLDVFDLVNKDRQLQKILYWDLGGRAKELKRSAMKRRELICVFHSKIESLLLADGSQDKAHLCLLLSSVLFFSIAESDAHASFYGLEVSSKSGKDRFVNVLENVIAYGLNDARGKKTQKS